MNLLLAGDIGGTKTVLRLVEASDESILLTLYEERYRSRDFRDLVPMVQQFLATAAQKLGDSSPPARACFAIAPVINNTVKLTNLAWFVDAKRLEAELGIKHVALINDFEAVGHGILGLDASDLYSLQSGNIQPIAPIAVIGAGTGLGEGFLIQNGDSYRVFSSEGGHADFAPRSELEFQLLKYLLDKHDIGSVSIERVVSGQGIIAIYQFLRDWHFASESPTIGQIVRTWEEEAGKGERSVDPAAVIASAALETRSHLRTSYANVCRSLRRRSRKPSFETTALWGFVRGWGNCCQNLTFVRRWFFSSCFYA